MVLKIILYASKNYNYYKYCCKKLSERWIVNLLSLAKNSTGMSKEYNFFAIETWKRLQNIKVENGKKYGYPPKTS